MRQSKTSLFLMELIICILFFSLAAAVCVQLFVRSHNLSLYTVGQSESMIVAENLAESFYATEGDVHQIQNLFRYSDLTASVEVPVKTPMLSIFYDDDWNETSDSETASYVASLVVFQPGEASNPSENLTSGTITVTSLANRTKLYELEVRVHERLKLSDIQ